MDRHNHFALLHKHLHMSKVLHNQYNDLVIADTFRTLALSMISLFIPIFLIKNGYTLIEVAFYELGIIFSGIFINYFMLKFVINFLGIKKTLIVSYFVNVLFYISLNQHLLLGGFFGKYGFLILIGLFEIVASASYWMSHHMYFLKSTRAKSSGKKLAVLYGVPAFLGMVAPFLGSVFITKLSFEVVFLFVSMLLMAAGYSLFFSKDIKAPKARLSWEKTFDVKSSTKNMMHFVMGANHYTTAIIWPLLMFFLSIKIVTMGAIYLISNFIYSLMMYFTGKRMDIKGNRSLAKVGALGHGCSLIFRAFSTSLVLVTSFQSMGALFGGIMQVSFEGGFYRSSYRDAAAMIMNREFYLHIGRCALMLILIGMLMFFNAVIALIGMMVLVGLSTIILNVLIRSDKSIMN